MVNIRLKNRSGIVKSVEKLVLLLQVVHGNVGRPQVSKTDVIVLQVFQSQKYLVADVSDLFVIETFSGLSPYYKFSGEIILRVLIESSDFVKF